MGYLLTEIVVYLVIAGLIGFVFGWLVRDGALDKYFNKFVEFINKTWIRIKGLFVKLTTSKEVVKEETTNLKENTKEVVEEEIKKELQESVSDVQKVEEAKVSVKEITPETVTEVIKEEVKLEKPIEEEVKVKEETKADVVEVAAVVETAKEEVSELTDETSTPTLFSEAPAEGEDKLSTLKGLGPVLEKKLNTLGVYTFEQIASWTSEQALWVGTQLSSPNKVIKGEWVKQAKELLKNK